MTLLKLFHEILEQLEFKLVARRKLSVAALARVSDVLIVTLVRRQVALAKARTRTDACDGAALALWVRLDGLAVYALVQSEETISVGNKVVHQFDVLNIQLVRQGVAVYGPSRLDGGEGHGVILHGPRHGQRESANVVDRPPRVRILGVLQKVEIDVLPALALFDVFAVRELLLVEQLARRLLATASEREDSHVRHEVDLHPRVGTYD
mmetsp:Transcript_44922/g.123121  ORF Transcript_44922/g.123121 Transcript_44922/m.123121 type:complete len:208 (+) Transcript_44922:990-1613(+)